jgi:hypothetical protein
LCLEDFYLLEPLEHLSAISHFQGRGNPEQAAYFHPHFAIPSEIASRFLTLKAPEE